MTHFRERVPHPQTGRPLDLIELEGQRVECIVGLYPSEEDAPQPLDVSVVLHLDTAPAATDTGLRHSVDYARLSGEIRFLLESCRFRTLETAAHALARYVLAPPTQDLPHARIEAVDVRLSKPLALGAALPSVSIRRYAVDQTWVVENKQWGLVDIVFEHPGSATDPGCGVYRLRVGPGKAIPTHVHRVMHEAELALGAGLLLQRKPVRAGTALRWPHDLPHRWDNPTTIERTILCVDRPRFIPADEIEVGDVPLSDVQGRTYYPAEATEEPAKEHA